ncbi:hypothetical protein R1flu_002937 [Riccia fluitans]|uniref:Uncharacterized protein n=1 Tax=Riccia fluitans TaxID=41844 RepID=A0ABD1YAJ5_9MARC
MEVARSGLFRNGSEALHARREWIHMVLIYRLVFICPQCLIVPSALSRSRVQSQIASKDTVSSMTAHPAEFDVISSESLRGLEVIPS